MNNIINTSRLCIDFGYFLVWCVIPLTPWLYRENIVDYFLWLETLNFFLTLRRYFWLILCFSSMLFGVRHVCNPDTKHIREEVRLFWDDVCSKVQLIILLIVTYTYYVGFIPIVLIPVSPIQCTDSWAKHGFLIIQNQSRNTAFFSLISGVLNETHCFYYFIVHVFFQNLLQSCSCPLRIWEAIGFGKWIYWFRLYCTVQMKLENSSDIASQFSLEWRAKGDDGIGSLWETLGMPQV